ncbi:hypothetical protein METBISCDRAFT_24404 [Metschnikowia bicuspidata]|uniref:Amino acid transporter n=1 Tax=Metschnikowia bicuspidata TaxID=27322 RepID=A0A4P9Z939_9ASCO|nr:hypothetical protein METBISCDRAFT_24404 [Metschnikowia bicuspidata]
MNIHSIISNQLIVFNIDHEVDSNEARILALGYKQEFRSEFSTVLVFAILFSVLGLLPSVAFTFDYDYQQLVLGTSPIPWLIAVFGITALAYSMVEVASLYPTSAGTPYAVAQLSPKKWAPFLTWITCFSNWMMQVTAAPGVNYSGACLMLAMASYNSGYVAPTGVVYALSTIMIMHAVVSFLPTKYLAQLNNIGTTIKMLFLVIFFLIIFACKEHLSMYGGSIPKFNSNSVTWSLSNRTDFPTGVAVLISFLGVIWAMSGYDALFHLSEECSNATISVPRAICRTATLGGGIGFIFMLAISHIMVNLGEVAADPMELGQPFVAFLAQIMENKYAMLCAALAIVSSWFMGRSCMLAASRVTFSYSRDGLFPFCRYWRVVDKTTQTPINTVIISFFVGQALLFLMFADDTAIGAVFSVGRIAALISFIMPVILRLTFARKTFEQGPWNTGRMSVPIGISA